MRLLHILWYMNLWNIEINCICQHVCWLLIKTHFSAVYLYVCQIYISFEITIFSVGFRTKHLKKHFFKSAYVGWCTASLLKSLNLSFTYYYNVYSSMHFFVCFSFTAVFRFITRLGLIYLLLVIGANRVQLVSSNAILYGFISGCGSWCCLFPWDILPFESGVIVTESKALNDSLCFWSQSDYSNNYVSL